MKKRILKAKPSKTEYNFRERKVYLEQIAVQHVLPYIADYVHVNGYPPLLSDIGDAFQKTRSWAKHVVDYLVKNGFLKQEPKKKRSLKLTNKSLIIYEQEKSEK